MLSVKQCLNVASSVLVIASGAVVGAVIALDQSSDSMSGGTLGNQLLASAAAVSLAFVTVWLATARVLVWGVFARERMLSIMRRDAVTYAVFLIAAVKLRSFPVSEIRVLLGFLLTVSVVFKCVLFRQQLSRLGAQIAAGAAAVWRTSGAIYSAVTTVLMRFDVPLKKWVLAGRVLLIIYIALIGASRMADIYRIPVNQPYFVGEWDDPFSINAGINILRFGGDQRFYNYGGTVVMPQAVLFAAHNALRGTKAEYRYLDQPFAFPNWPITRKIHPVRPIYWGKILAIMLFTFGTCLLAALVSWYLLPVPLLVFRMVDHSSILAYYHTALIGITESTLLAGVTTIFFFMTLLADDRRQYARYLLWCALAASLTAATKANTGVIVLLPLSLLAHMGARYGSVALREGKAWLVCLVTLVIPYVVVTPAVVLNAGSYFAWLVRTVTQPHPAAFTWMDRTGQIFPFIRDMYIVQTMPNLWLIALVIIGAILMVRISPLAFAAFAFFNLYSFQSVANITMLGLYARLFIFLLLPVSLFVLFPLMCGYKRIPAVLKVIVLGVSLGTLINAFPPQAVSAGLRQLMTGTFAGWAEESRDAFAHYVIDNNLKVYFFDLHHFGLPDTVYDRIVPFSDSAALPAALGKNEVVAYIRYSVPDQPDGQQANYWRVVQYLDRRFVPMAVFGEEQPGYDMWGDAPAHNPTIVLLKQKH